MRRNDGKEEIEKLDWYRLDNLSIARAIYEIVGKINEIIERINNGK